MTDRMPDQRLDREIRAFLDWQAEQVAGAPSAMEIAMRISTGGRTRPAALHRSPRLTWVVLAALLVMMLVGAALIGALSQRPVIDTPMLSQRPVVDAPSPSSDPSPSLTIALTWTQSSLDQDWPAPVRAEPAGGSGVVDRVPGAISYTDPHGDIGPGAPAWVDIGEMTISAHPPDQPGVDLIIGTTYGKPIPTPRPDPREQWIAYGLVLDINEDGRPDIRLGIDNMPVSGEPAHRAWRTDLDAGTTVSAAGAPYGFVGDTYFDTFFPGEGQVNGTRLGVDMPDGATYRFYAWASVIAEGRVVATDYAPDAGWFDPWP